MYLRKSGKHNLTQTMTVNITSKGAHEAHTPDHRLWWEAPMPWQFCQNVYMEESNHGETSDKPKVRDILQNNWLESFQNVMKF